MMTRDDIRKLVEENPASFEEAKLMSLIAIVAEMIGQDEMSRRAKLIVMELLTDELN